MEERPGLTVEQDSQLAKLLGYVHDALCFWPQWSWRALQRNISLWAPELVITRPRESDGHMEILLARYDGGVSRFAGLWHIPGGYDKKFDPRTGRRNSSFEDAADMVAERELRIEVRVGEIIGRFKWPTREEDPVLGHPDGTPLSLYVEAYPLGPVVENDRLRWFSVDHLPQEMVEPHRLFIESDLACPEHLREAHRR